jgi:hypothetical protein
MFQSGWNRIQSGDWTRKNLASPAELAATLEAEMQPYWLKLGRLIHTFAAIEADLQEALAADSGLPKHLAKVVFKGMQVDRSIDQLRAIWRAGEKKPETFLINALTQLSVLNRARNDLVHYGAQFNGQHWETPQSALVRVLQLDDLDDMISDAGQIRAAFTAHALTFSVGRGQEIRAYFVGVANEPWRFNSIRGAPGNQRK